MAKKRITTAEPAFNDHPILTDKKKGLRCDTKILNKINEVVGDFFDNHDRGFFMRYDIRYPEDYTCDPVGNDDFRRFQANFVKNLSRADLDPHYVATREQGDSNNHHYHAMLLLDGRKTQSIHNHIRKADELWSNALKVPQTTGLIEDCTKDKNGNKQRNGVMLRKDDPDFKVKLDNCMKRASYLAKENQKSSTPDNTRELFSTRRAKGKA